jgi:hypothetical protein
MENVPGFDSSTIPQGSCNLDEGWLNVPRAFVNYFAHVISDGDTMNDWLCHLPWGWQVDIYGVGEELAYILRILGI